MADNNTNDYILSADYSVIYERAQKVIPILSDLETVASGMKTCLENVKTCLGGDTGLSKIFDDNVGVELNQKIQTAIAEIDNSRDALTAISQTYEDADNQFIAALSNYNG